MRAATVYRVAQTARQHHRVLTGKRGGLMARYDRRIATRITRDADNRLRLAALAFRRPLSALLTEVIDQALPTADELTERLREDSVEAGAA
jgi:hypothetical protein